MLIDVNAWNMDYLLLTVVLCGLTLSLQFILDVRRTFNIFKKIKPLKITYQECYSFSDIVALFIVRKF
jgi:hypothetical protein